LLSLVPLESAMMCKQFGLVIYLYPVSCIYSTRTPTIIGVGDGHGMVSACIAAEKVHAFRTTARTSCT
jgi:hypothetical protein